MQIRFAVWLIVACLTVGGVANAAEGCNASFPARLPIECWAGQKFLVLPTEYARTTGGYQAIWSAGDDATPARFEALNGHTVTVEAVDWSEPEDHPALGHWHLTLRDDANGLTYTAQSGPRGTDRGDTDVGDLVLKRDFDEATVRYPGRDMFLVTDLPSGLHRGDLVHITSITLGPNWREPIRIEFESQSGQTGHADVALSATNFPRPYPDKVGDAALSEYFSAKKPKPEPPPSKRDRDAVDHKQVYIGMSERAALKSWGQPDQINRTITGHHVHEQWVYGMHEYLYFDDGVLTAIQD